MYVGDEVGPDDLVGALEGLFEKAKVGCNVVESVPLIIISVDAMRAT